MPLKNTLALALLVCGLLSTHAHADTITVRADEWCPYNCAPDARKVGFGIEIAKVIFEKAGHTIDYKILPWKQSIEETRAGKHNAILGATKSEVPDFIYPKSAIGLYQTGYASLKETPFEYGGPNSLSGKLLAAIEGYAYDEEIDTYIEAHKNNPQRIVFSGGEDPLVNSFALLQKGKADLVVDGVNVLLYKTDKLQISDLIHIARPNRFEKIYLTFSPKNPKSQEYASIYDKGLAEIRADGSLRTIMMRYGLTEWDE